MFQGKVLVPGKVTRTREAHQSTVELCVVQVQTQPAPGAGTPTQPELA
jgi:hypothetical protein